MIRTATAQCLLSPSRAAPLFTINKRIFAPGWCRKRPPPRAPFLYIETITGRGVNCNAVWKEPPRSAHAGWPLGNGARDGRAKHEMIAERRGGGGSVHAVLIPLWDCFLCAPDRHRCFVFRFCEIAALSSLIIAASIAGVWVGSLPLKRSLKQSSSYTEKSSVYATYAPSCGL